MKFRWLKYAFLFVLVLAIAGGGYVYKQSHGTACAQAIHAGLSNNFYWFQPQPGYR